MKRFFLVALLGLILAGVTGCKKNSGDSPDQDEMKVIEETIVTAEEVKGALAKYIGMKDGTLGDAEALDKYDKFASRIDELAEGGITLVSLKVIYPSTDLSTGNKVNLSGKIYVRRDQYYVWWQVGGLLLANHYTMGSNDEVPSNACQYEAAFAWNGYAVVMPDYQGYGSTRGMVHPYLNAEATARASLDMLYYAEKYLQGKKIKVGPKRYNVGYSQGGAAAIAVQKVAQRENKVVFDKTYAGGGPYDIRGTYDLVVSTNKTGIPAAIPFIILGMDASYNLKLNMADFFQKPLADNYNEWINMKNYTVDKIDQLLGGDNVDVDKVLTKTALTPTDPKTKPIIDAMDRNSLIKDWVPSKKTKIYLMHSTKDDVVPVLNANGLSAMFLAAGYGAPELTLDINAYSSHKLSGAGFMAYVEYDLPFVLK